MQTRYDIREKLLIAIIDAFFLPDFILFFRLRLNQELSEVVNTAAGFKYIVSDAIEWAFQCGEIDRLIVQSYKWCPNNPMLKKFWLWYRPLTIEQPTQALEAWIKKQSKLHDFQSTIMTLQTIQSQICRIELPDGTSGTGFLVGSDIILTNYHVVNAVIDNRVSSDSVIIRFDYTQVNDQSVTLNKGNEYGLSQKWLIDASKWSDSDFDSSGTSIPNVDELDYALIHLAECVGNMASPHQASNNLQKRGWITLSENYVAPVVGGAIFIAQHPQDLPLQLAIDTEGITEINDNCTRIRYNVSTLPGASGSPCFNQDWKLVALHHASEACFKPTYNQGIPIVSIINLLSARGCMIS